MKFVGGILIGLLGFPCLLTDNNYPKNETLKNPLQNKLLKTHILKINKRPVLPNNIPFARQ